MSQNSGSFLVPSHGHSLFNPRMPSSSMSPSLKRSGNGPMSLGNVPNSSLNSNMNALPSNATMRPSNSMGPLKPPAIPMNSMEKSNSMPYSSRYSRKTWLTSRSMHDKNIRGHDEHESAYARPSTSSHNVAPENMSTSSFTIEPAVDDDENEDIYFSSRHVAGARFQRNQHLIAEIFNEVRIPDLRTNVSVDRILTLRRQVDALKRHRDTFDKDLNDLEEKHAEKKRKFTEANEKFYSEYAEASAKNLSQEKIEEILQKHAAMEKLQKEKQLLLLQQQQQAAAATPPQPPSTSSLSSTTPTPITTTTTTTTTTVAATVTTPTMTVVASEAAASTVVKTESEITGEVSQEDILSTPPPPVQTQAPSTQPASTTVAHAQSAPSPTLPYQPVPAQLPPVHSVPVQLPPTQSIQSQMAPSQPTQPTQQQMPPVMQQMPMQQHQPPVTMASQGYPMMHSGGGYAPAPGYAHPQQAQYRPPMNQRPVQYPSNVQWQQQQQQQSQQWQTNTYDPRYYNAYPTNAQWSQQPQPQQWPTNLPPQQMGVVSHQQQASMRGPPMQQPTNMYGNSAHYGYGSTTAGWNTGGYPPQSYGYPQNPSYDPSMVSAHPQQQYYSQPQMHNAPQGYEYAPPPQQQSQQQQQQQQPPPQMN